jgi:hypothetical protein
MWNSSMKKEWIRNVNPLKVARAQEIIIQIKSGVSFKRTESSEQ